MDNEIPVGDEQLAGTDYYPQSEEYKHSGQPAKLDSFQFTVTVNKIVNFTIQADSLAEAKEKVSKYLAGEDDFIYDLIDSGEVTEETLAGIWAEDGAKIFASIKAKTT